MKELDELSASTAELIARYRALQQENRSLRETNEQQRAEIMRTHAELLDIQQKYKQLHIAHAVSASAEDRERAKAQISALIQRVNYAIDVLKQ